MVTNRRISHVTIKDNGLRAFVPPCFCFELLDLNGNEIEAVSDIEVLVREPTLKRIMDLEVPVSGRLEIYTPTESADLDEGIRLVIERVEQ